MKIRDLQLRKETPYDGVFSCVHRDANLWISMLYLSAPPPHPEGEIWE